MWRSTDVLNLSLKIHHKLIIQTAAGQYIGKLYNPDMLIILDDIYDCSAIKDFRLNTMKNPTTFFL